METIWVLENVKGSRSFYSRFNILMYVASISLWKKYHPTHKTVLYIDEMSCDVFHSLDILTLWDTVRELKYPEKINRGIFWSGAKTKIISETQIPLLVVDHDFLIFRNIDEYLNSEILCTYDELANNWYPSKSDRWGCKLTTPIEHIVDRATNVSLFYLPDPTFANRYAKQTLKNHEEFTAMNAAEMNANHMIYSEQFMLRQWIEKEKVPYRTLCKNIWDCSKETYTAQTWDKGYWDLDEAYVSYKHYGVDKRKVLDNRPGYEYANEISFLYRCINAGKLVSVEQLQNKLKQIGKR